MAGDLPRRRVLALAGTAATTALAGCSSVFGENEQGTPKPFDDGAGPPAEGTDGSTRDGRDESTPEPEDGPTSTESTPEPWSTEDVTIDSVATELADVPIANDDAQYPRMGLDEATTTATVYGNWKCPYTREFFQQQLPTIVAEFVEPGDLELEFRALSYLDGGPFLGPDAPRAARAGLAVWNVDPATFWEYAETVFGNQPAERNAWAQTSLLLRFAEAVDVAEATTVERAIEDGQYEQDVRATTRAAGRLDVGTIPRLVVDGTVTAPTVTPERAGNTLERAIER